MSDTRTTDRQSTDVPQEAQSRGAVAVFAPPRLDYHPAIEERFGVDRAGWYALIDAVWPLAQTTESVCLALSYCRARKLDPFKKVVHIVPMWSSVQKRMVETVWPGVAELRTTAFRTTEYAGHDPVEYGPDKEEQVGSATIKFPEWCRMTVHRIVHKHIRAFPGPRVYWTESYAQTKRDDQTPNAMWKKRPYGQLEKCAEAAALRAAFPEEIGNEYAAEEMEGKIMDNAPGDVAATGPRPSSKSMMDRAKVPDAETYPLIDHIGEIAEKAAYPEQWAKALLAESAPTVDNKFTDKAIGYLVNNAEACETMYPLIKDDALVTQLQARYAAAEEQRQETLPGGNGAVGDAEGSPAAAAPRNEITESAPTLPPASAPPGAGPAGAEPPTASLPAAAVKAETPPASPVPEPPQAAPAPEKQPEGPKAIPMPMSAKTNKPDSAAYLIAIQKEMTEAATQPEHIDMILTREGYLGPRKYTPGSNLAVIMLQTSGSIEMFATRRKQTLANVPQS